MPVKERSHYYFQWNTVTEDGRSFLVSLGVEDILPDMVEGLTPVEIVLKYNAPVQVIEHLISCIPEFMTWRNYMAHPQIDLYEDISQYIDEMRAKRDSEEKEDGEKKD